MANQEIVEQVIKLSVTGQQQTQAALASLQASYVRMQAEIADTNKELDKTRDKLKNLKGDEFDKATLKVTKLEEKVSRLNVSLAETANKFNAAGEAANNPTAGKLERVVSAGSLLRSLPSTPIPGTSLTTDLVANVIRFVGSIDKIKEVFKSMPEIASSVVSAIGATNVGLIGSLGALAVVFLLLQQRTAAVAAAAKTDLDAREAALKLLKTSSDEEIQARINTLATQRRVNEELLEDAKNQLAGVRAAIVQGAGGGQGGLVALGQQELLSAIGQGSGELIAAKKNVEELSKAVSETSVEVDILTGFTGKSAQTTEELAAAEEALNRARSAAAYLIAEINNQTNNEIEIRRLLETGTSEQLAKRLDDLKFEQQLYAEQAAELRVLQNLQKEGTAAYNDYRNAAEGYETKARAAEDAIRDLGDATLEAGIKAREAAEYTEEQNKDLANAVDKYNNDIEKAEAATAEKRLGIQQKLNDTLVKIASDAVDNAQKILDRLKDKRAELTKDAERDELKAAREANFEQLEDQIKFQENEVKAARDLEKRLKDIRDSAAADTEDAAFQRDFARLFEIERNKTRQINSANEEATAAGQERLEAFRSQQADAQRQREFEHNERMIRLEEARADTLAAFEAEQKQNEINRIKAINAAQFAANNELRQLNTKNNAELSARARAITEELRLINLGGNARIQAEADIQNALVAQARRILSGIGGNTGSVGGRYAPTTRAFGGGLGAGQASFVNDGFKGQREQFAGSSFPSGLGLFIPAKSGTVTPQGGAAGRGNITLNLTQNIKGNNDEQIARISAKMINDTLRELVA